MLRNLKEKKDQILNENITQKNKKQTKNTKTFKREKTITEIDESYLNENAVVNNLPKSIINVNKPSDDKMYNKKKMEEIELYRETSIQNSQDNSQINEDDSIEEQEINNYILKSEKDINRKSENNLIKNQIVRRRSNSNVNYFNQVINK